MGVEPTAACSAQPATSFEDWGAHRDATTPVSSLTHSGQFCTNRGSTVRIAYFVLHKVA